MRRKYIWLVISVLLFSACGSTSLKSDSGGERPVLTVTIEPLRYFTEAIAGTRFTVESIVPRGSSPETYDPTPSQLLALADSRAYLRIGYIGFEQVWMKRLMANAPDMPVFDTSKGIDLIVEDEGPEPHIWTSAVNARVIATNVAMALCALDSIHSSEYRHRCDSLITVINRTDSLCRSLLSGPDADRMFLIYHPSLSYFARDYGLRQLPIEEAGKEPTPARLKELLDYCQREKVNVIFVQPEFDRRNAELIARQTGSRIVPINPLAYDWQDEMLHVARTLALPESLQ